MAVLPITPIELFVKAFVRQNAKYPKKIAAVYIQKAKSLIDQKLGFCCYYPDSSLPLYTPKENLLTQTIRMYLNTMTRAGNEHSLERTKALLEAFRADPCCA